MFVLHTASYFSSDEYQIARKNPPVLVFYIDLQIHHTEHLQSPSIPTAFTEREHPMHTKYLFPLSLVLLLTTACGPITPGQPGTTPLSPDASAWANTPLSDTHTALQEDIRYIIHAAGTLDGLDGSNSLEGLTKSVEAGCKYIELDFQFTADGELACIHDWYTQYTDAIPENGTALTLDAFQNCKIYGTYTPLWLDSLATFLEEHPDIYIITDIKDRNVEGAAKIAADYPHLTDRFIVQIYDGSEYDPVREAGFEHIIYTLYRLDWHGKTDTAALSAFAAEHPLLAYTFSYELCDVEGYVDGMKNAGVPLYIHTVNGETEQEMYFEMGIDGIYTDERK